MPHETVHLQKTILIDVIPKDFSEAVSKRRVDELLALTETYGGIAVVTVIQKRAIPDYRTHVGKGKLEEVLVKARESGATLLVINHALKPRQLYEVQTFFRANKHPVTVWDRVGLILHIFSKHAQTAEALLQIKLAAIQHMGPLIFGMGMELMRQGGGIGGRGAGETNTELMKRHLADQERSVRQKLEQIAKGRSLHRKRRDRINLKTTSIVGYTNAGKSSLLHALTKKKTLVANALFATLDTRVGKLWLPSVEKEVLLSDTIGFIQDLPPNLIDAFRSTLDETVDADLLLQVIDAGDPFVQEKIHEVDAILASLGVEKTPRLYVFNKCDTVKKTELTALKKRFKALAPIFVSAKDGTGLDALTTQIAETLFPK